MENFRRKKEEADLVSTVTFWVVDAMNEKPKRQRYAITTGTILVTIRLRGDTEPPLRLSQEDLLDEVTVGRASAPLLFHYYNDGIIMKRRRVTMRESELKRN